MDSKAKEFKYGCNIVMVFALAVVTGLFGRGVHLLCIEINQKAMSISLPQEGAK